MIQREQESIAGSAHKNKSREGISLSAQEEKLKAYCELKGWQIIKTKKEVKSAKDMNRPKLNELLAEIEKGKINVLVIYKLDRLGRSLMDLLKMGVLLEKYKCEICSYTESIDTTSASGRAFYQMLGVFAEFENAIKKERVEFAFQAKLSEGKVLSRAPIGYRMDSKNQLVPDVNADTIREIFRLTIEGIRAEEICNRIEITRKKKGAYYKVYLPLSTYYRIIRNPIYCGIYNFRDKQIDIKFEPLISPEDFKKVKSLLKKRNDIQN